MPNAWNITLKNPGPNGIGVALSQGAHVPFLGFEEAEIERNERSVFYE